MNVRAQRKAATRERVIKAARELFGRKGYAHTGIREIAAKVGMSTGAVFNCFANKAEVFEAALGAGAPDGDRLWTFLERVAASPLVHHSLRDEARDLRAHLLGAQP